MVAAAAASRTTVPRQLEEGTGQLHMLGRTGEGRGRLELVITSLIDRSL